MSQLTRLRTALEANSVPAAVLTDSVNIRWLTGFAGSFGFALVTPSQAVLITDSRYAIQAAEQAQGFEVRIFQSPVTGIQFLKENLDALGVADFGFESQTMTHGAFLQWQRTFEGRELRPLGGIIDELRMIKNADEVAKIKRACDLADATFDHVRRIIQPGITEYDVHLEIEFFIRRNGAHLAFEPIVVSGANSARPHGKATEKLLERGDLLTMDFGAELEGYCSDITRTVLVGDAPERQRDLYNLVLRAQLACLGAMRPGAIAGDIDKIARDTFAEAGLDKHFGHGLGHGLGMHVHDPGGLRPNATTVLEPGQVWTVEPGLYIEGFGGCRIEDDVVVTENGIDILTQSTKELLVLG